MTYRQYLNNLSDEDFAVALTWLIKFGATMSDFSEKDILEILQTEYTEAKK